MTNKFLQEFHPSELCLRVGRRPLSSGVRGLDIGRRDDFWEESFQEHFRVLERNVRFREKAKKDRAIERGNMSTLLQSEKDSHAIQLTVVMTECVYHPVGDFTKVFSRVHFSPILFTDWR